MNKTGQSLLYDSQTGKCNFIDKRVFVRTYMRNAVPNTKDFSDYALSPIVNKNYEIIIKRFEQMKKLSTGIYAYQIPSSKNLLVCLIDKTIEDFQKFCKRQGWKVGEVNQNAPGIISVPKNYSLKHKEVEPLIYESDYDKYGNPKEHLGEKVTMSMKKNVIKKMAVATLVGLSSVSMIACSSVAAPAQPLTQVETQINETKESKVAESKKQETQKATEAKKEIKSEAKETVAQETVKQEKKSVNYAQFFNDDEYFAGIQVKGEQLLVSWYSENDDGVLDKTLPTYIEVYPKFQADYILALQNKRTVKNAHAPLSADKTCRIIDKYTLMNGQVVTLPQNQRIQIQKTGDLDIYYVELMLNGNQVTLSNSLTNHEMNKINRQKNAEELAKSRAEHEAYMAQQKELADAMWAKHEERDAENRAEAQENAANTAAFKQISLNAYAQIGNILSQYATSSTNIAGKNIGEMMEANSQDAMTRNDKSIRTITVNGKGSYKIPIDLLPQAREECISVIDDAINELENYTSGVKDSLASGAKSVIKDLNKFKSKLY